MKWWARRQFSRGRAVPYDRGTYRAGWAAYPELIRQYHPELNHGIALSQIPLAADVLLCWECAVGHRFAATPTEQRERRDRCGVARRGARSALRSPVRSRSCSAKLARFPESPVAPRLRSARRRLTCLPGPRS